MWWNRCTNYSNWTGNVFITWLDLDDSHKIALLKLYTSVLKMTLGVIWIGPTSKHPMKIPGGGLIQPCKLDALVSQINDHSIIFYCTVQTRWHHTRLNGSLILDKTWLFLFSLTPWASYQIRKFAGCSCAGNARNVFPATGFKGNR